MATRIHVAGVRNVPLSELREELKELGEFEYRESSGWVWFITSVWIIPGRNLLNKLKTIPRTVFLATTEDGARWYLRLRGPGQEPFDLCHEFSLLDEAPATSDSDWEEEEEPHFDVSEFTLALAEPGGEEADDRFFNEDEETGEEDYEEEPEGIAVILKDMRELLGTPVPEEVEEHLRALPTGQAVRGLLNWESAALIGALQRFGVPHDPSTVASIILGESVTNAELESDLGNLPRLLSALGFGEYFDDWVAQVSALGDGEALEEEEFTPEIIPYILDRADTVAIRSLTEGPVELPLRKIHAAALLAQFCDEDANAVFRIVLPEGAEGSWSLKPANWLELDVRDGEVLAAPYTGEILAGTEGRRLGERLADLPDAARVAVITAGTRMQSGRHRYEGVVRTGRWHIEQAAPCHDTHALREALDLALDVLDDQPVAARNEAEAAAVLADAKKAQAFVMKPLQYSGHAFQVSTSQRAALGRLVFRQRFRNFWDVAEGEKQDAADYAEWLALRKEISQRLGIPHTDRVVFEGDSSLFLEVDLDRLRPSLVQTIKEADAEWEHAGFRVLGAFTEDGMPAMIMRMYVRTEGNTFAVAYPQETGDCWRDCYTRFEQGASLTTSNMPGHYSLRRRGIFHRKSGATTARELYAEHRKGLTILEKRGLVPSATEPTLEAAARAMDDYLRRRRE